MGKPSRAGPVAAGLERGVSDRLFAEGFRIVGCYFAFPILKTVAPQTEHLPRVAGLPFFSVTCSALLISRWSRHLRQ